MPPSSLLRLCDKSPSVRRRAAALLSALANQVQAPAGAAPGLSAGGAARLADAVLPVASQLLGLRPDSALHPGEEGMKVCGRAAGVERQDASCCPVHTWQMCDRQLTAC